MWVEMTYPPTGGRADFPAGAVDLWRERGWVPTAELTPAEAEQSTSDNEPPPQAADKKPAKPATRGESQE